MPRASVFPYTYSLPPTYLAVANTTISSNSHNTTLQDIQSTFNTVQPINYGGTGASDAATALSNLGGVSSTVLTGYVLKAGDTMTGALVNTNTAAGVSQILASSTDAGAAAGPISELYRDSTSPAVNDILGRTIWYGRDSANNKQEYASLEVVIVDPVSTTEDASLDLYVVVAGTRTRVASFTSTLSLPNAPLTVASGGTGLATLTAHSVLTGNGTGTLTSVAPSTSGNVLTSNGTDWTSAAPAAAGQPIPSSSTYAVGTFVLLNNQSGGTVNDGSTTAGSGLRTITNTAGAISATAVSVTGTWKNVHGSTLNSGAPSGGNDRIGYFVRTV